MSNTVVHILVGTLAVLSVSAMAVDAQAASVRVSCDSSNHRSRASVDGRNLAPGQYMARLTSGDHVATSPLQHTNGDRDRDGDEDEFDFDSDRDNDGGHDDDGGSTRINRHFIVDHEVMGEILDADGNVVASKTAKCNKRGG